MLLMYLRVLDSVRYRSLFAVPKVILERRLSDPKADIADGSKEWPFMAEGCRCTAI